MPVRTKLRHGSPSFYIYGCRCARCSKAMRDYTWLRYVPTYARKRVA